MKYISILLLLFTACNQPLKPRKINVCNIDTVKVNPNREYSINDWKDSNGEINSDLFY